MKILETSDLHFGFNVGTEKIIENFLNGADKKIDLIILAGDIISDNISQFGDFFNLYRKYFPRTLTIMVPGNHDFWGECSGLSGFSISTKITDIIDELAGYDIIFLDGMFNYKYTLKDYVFYGSSNWYTNKFPPSNDYRYIIKSNSVKSMYEKDFHKQMKEKFAIKFFDKVFNDIDTTKTNLLITHMNPSFLGKLPHPMSGYIGAAKLIEDSFDYCFFGHDHKEFEKTIGKCKFINCGSDYNKPKAKYINTIKGNNMKVILTEDGPEELCEVTQR